MYKLFFLPLKKWKSVTDIEISKHVFDVFSFAWKKRENRIFSLVTTIMSYEKYAINQKKDIFYALNILQPFYETEKMIFFYYFARVLHFQHVEDKRTNFTSFNF